MKKFITAEYEFNSPKIREPWKFLMISDLHNVCFGEDNEVLVKKIYQENPDGILIGGDLLIGKPGVSVLPALSFVRQAVGCCPVYYSLGNHEYRMKVNPERFEHQYQRYERELQKAGVILLENQHITLKDKKTSVNIYGLELPMKYYERKRRHGLSQRELNLLLGKPEESAYNILLAHNPRFTDAYLDWGADLALSGHYHGGMVRLPFTNGLISPYMTLFPKYCHGLFTKEGKYAVVSAGMGEHTIPLRIFNPREMLVIRLKPEV